MNIDENSFEIKKQRLTNPKRPNDVELLVEVEGNDTIVFQIHEEGAYAGDVDSLGTIELTRDELLALRAFLDEQLR